MILPKIRDPRFITMRRGGTLQPQNDVRDLVLDDQRLRNELCWFAFDC